MTNQNSSSPGSPWPGIIAVALTVALVAAKTSGLLAIPWWVAFLPFTLTAGLALLGITILLLSIEFINARK